MLTTRFYVLFEEVPQYNCGVKIYLGDSKAEATKIAVLKKWISETVKMELTRRFVYPSRMAFYLPNPGRSLSLRPERFSETLGKRFWIKRKYKKQVLSEENEFNVNTDEIIDLNVFRFSNSAIKINKFLIERFFFHVQNRGYFERAYFLIDLVPRFLCSLFFSLVLPQLFRQEVISHGYQPDGAISGVHLLDSALKKIHSALPDLEIKILSTNLVATSEERYVCHWEATGTHEEALWNIPASQKKIKFSAVTVFVFKEWKISSQWLYWELPKLLSQISNKNQQSK